MSLNIRIEKSDNDGFIVTVDDWENEKFETEKYVHEDAVAALSQVARSLGDKSLSLKIESL